MPLADTHPTIDRIVLIRCVTSAISEHFKVLQQFFTLVLTLCDSWLKLFIIYLLIKRECEISPKTQFRPPQL